MASELITRRSVEPELGEPNPNGLGFAGPPKRARSAIAAEATKLARRRVTRKRVSCVRKLDLPKQVAGAHRSERRLPKQAVPAGAGGAHRGGLRTTQSAD
jgi:hypothetical protein